MGDIPNVQIKTEASAKWLKHIERLETNVFPTCHTIEREWTTYTSIIPLRKSKHFMYVHHRPECKYEITHVRQGGEDLDIKRY